MSPRLVCTAATTTLIATLAACQRAEAPSAVSPPAASAVVASAPALVVPPPIGTPQAPGVAWVPAATDAQVDAAFARAREQGKPVLLYWGADWCPPCNQLKATLFNRQDFIERTRAYVAVHVDGDAPGAQKLGERFRVRGYPTLVVYSPAGVEMTRLPGEVDAQQVTQMLTLGLAMRRPVATVLADARAGRAPQPDEWPLLAYAAPDAAVPAPELHRLAAACPDPQGDACTRLFLQAWAASGGAGADAKRPDAAARTRFLAVLLDAEAARTQMDLLTQQAEALATVYARRNGADRAELLDAYDATLAGLANDVTLSRADRLGASIARVQLARLDAPRPARGASAPAAPPALLSDVREQVARLDRETTDVHERQVVVTTAAYLLREAGAMAESDALLEANLARSHAPYYLMSALAGNAKRRGDAAAALRWSEAAYQRSEGAATRLQWGASHVAMLVELAPQDEPRIEAAALQVLREAAAQPHAYYERNARSLQRLGTALGAWSKAPGHAEARRRLQRELDALCAAVPEADAQRATCRGLLSAAPAKRAA